jgi:hypothetical protein
LFLKIYFYILKKLFSFLLNNTTPLKFVLKINAKIAIVFPAFNNYNGTLEGAYAFYFAIAIIACIVSVVIYVLHLLKMYKKFLKNWTKIVMF